jgi:hypothetical protein
LPEEMLRGLEEVALVEEVSLVAPGVMEEVVRRERLQRELLVVQLEELLVLALVEVELGEQWQEVVVESLAVVEHDNPLVLQQEELLGEELKTTPPQKLTPCCRPFGPFAQLAMSTGRLWRNCIAIAMQFAAGLLSPLRGSFPPWPAPSRAVVILPCPQLLH